MTFYQRTLGAAGWELRDRDVGDFFMAKRVGNRLHSVFVEAASGDEPLTEFELQYTIGLKAD